MSNRKVILIIKIIFSNFVFKTKSIIYKIIEYVILKVVPLSYTVDLTRFDLIYFS